MKSKMRRLAQVMAFVSLLAPTCVAEAPASLMRKQEVYTVSLDLKFSRKEQNSLQRFFSMLDSGPNGFATGFRVGDGLVMTAYHVISGNLSTAKKAQLGFGARDRLEVKAYVNGCEASVLRVDVEADLALLRVCASQKPARAPAFQTSLNQDEKLLLIARPRGNKMVKRGIFSGPYMVRGQQFWSAKIEGHDGYSGSPVYNDKAELIGVISGYDWSKNLAVISPGVRVQKLLAEYTATP